MSKVERLQKVNAKAQGYRVAQDAAAYAYVAFLDALYEAYHDPPKSERPTQTEIAQAIQDIPEYNRGRIAQFLVKARELQ